MYTKLKSVCCVGGVLKAIVTRFIKNVYCFAWTFICVMMIHVCMVSNTSVGALVRIHINNF